MQVACLGNQALNYLTTGVAPRRMGNAHPNIVPHQDFHCRRRHHSHRRQRRSVPQVLRGGRASRVGGRCPASPPIARVAHRAELIPLIRQVTVFHTTANGSVRWNRPVCPAGPINDLAQVFADPQVQHRG
ncbi:CoA transferase [Stutzerimonas xanthomarina]|uniref:CoA transferase n=1 Tax=Stutzerimonas xanthomarina TaxID=271420 RepID=UPI003AA92A0D